MHRAYYLARNETGYYAPETNKIIAFTQPFERGRPLAVGSTKATVAKYWVGAGALMPMGETYRPQVLTPKQLEVANFSWEPVNITGLPGKKFSPGTCAALI
ncbi:hypothetical protein IPL68_02235 [Candidatus Saccharibacteria bacterium]|nr:MAG: hypothetical protein IPL68_02235 [Candidatus Saccharibacteria bacterium]